jgi:hypothetical protein
MTKRKTPRIPIPQDTYDEVWLDVDGWEGLYMVSSLGRVYSIVREKFLKPGLKTKGYYQVVLKAVPGRPPKNATVHGLVAKAFIGPCPVGLEPNHIDGVKTNNTPGNLEYIKHQANVQHAWDNGLRKIRSGYSKLSADKVEEARRIWDGLPKTPSTNRFGKPCEKVARGALRELADGFGVCTGYMYMVATRKPRPQRSV